MDAEGLGVLAGVVGIVVLITAGTYMACDEDRCRILNASGHRGQDE